MKVIYECRFTRLHTDAKAPTKANPSDAGFDLYALHGARIEPGETVLIQTGIAIEPPIGWCASVRARSSLNRLGILAGLGLIDPAYRGSIGVTLTNAYHPGVDAYQVKAGDRIAQLVFEELPRIELVEVEELSTSERGAAGFGSSGR